MPVSGVVGRTKQMAMPVGDVTLHGEKPDLGIECRRVDEVVLPLLVRRLDRLPVVTERLLMDVVERALVSGAELPHRDALRPGRLWCRLGQLDLHPLRVADDVETTSRKRAAELLVRRGGAGQRALAPLAGAGLHPIQELVARTAGEADPDPSLADVLDACIRVGLHPDIERSVDRRRVPAAENGVFVEGRRPVLGRERCDGRRVLVSGRTQAHASSFSKVTCSLSTCMPARS